MKVEIINDTVFGSRRSIIAITDPEKESEQIIRKIYPEIRIGSDSVDGVNRLFGVATHTTEENDNVLQMLLTNPETGEIPSIHAMPHTKEIKGEPDDTLWENDKEASSLNHEISTIYKSFDFDTNQTIGFYKGIIKGRSQTPLDFIKLINAMMFFSEKNSCENAKKASLEWLKKLAKTESKYQDGTRLLKASKYLFRAQMEEIRKKNKAVSFRAYFMPLPQEKKNEVVDLIFNEFLAASTADNS